MNGQRPLDEDTLYYLLKDPASGDLLYVFSDYSHLFGHIPRGITGKCIYLHRHDGDLLPGGFKIKRINGLDFLNTAWKYDPLSREYQIYPDKAIKALTQGYLRLLLPNAEPLLKNYSVYDRTYAIACFPPRQVLPLVMEHHPRISAAISNISQSFGIPLSRLGITGSLALGAESAGDIDIVFYGGIGALQDVRAQISDYQKCFGPVEENGWIWPCRFYDGNGNLFCCFFNIQGDTYADCLKHGEISREKVRYTARVSDDTYSIAKTPFLRLDDGRYDALLLFDRAFKGIFKKGDTLSGSANVITCTVNGVLHRFLLSLSPLEEIDHWSSFVRRQPQSLHS